MATTPEEQALNIYGTAKVREIINKISQQAFQIDLMRDPHVALTKRPIKNEDGEIINKKLYDKWSRDQSDRIFSEVAKRTGAKIEDIENPETRTPEIEREVNKEIENYANLFSMVYFRSRYYQALVILRELKSESREERKGDPLPLDDNGIVTLLGQTVMYFFAVNDINPVSDTPLTMEQVEELKAIFYRLDKFYIDNPLPKGASDKEGLYHFLQFVEADTKDPEKINIIAKKIQEITYPLDKVNSTLWGLEIGKNNILKAESDRESRKGKQASINLLLDFADIGGAKVITSRPLTLYDKRVFIATANLAEQGNNVVTTLQIYRAMGNNGRPSAQDREKILKSLEFMSTIGVHIDTTEEAELYGNYQRVKSSFYLLSSEYVVGCKANGAIVKDAISIKYPYLFTFAKERKQVTMAPIALLAPPISMTEANLQLQDYLFRRIAQMKNKADCQKTILLETVYKNCGINSDSKSRMQRSRLTEKIERILNHYKECQWINDFEIDKRNIKIDV